MARRSFGGGVGVAGVLFLGYLYLSGRLAAVWKAVQNPAMMFPGTESSAGGATGSTGTAPASPTVVTPRNPEPGLVEGDVVPVGGGPPVHFRLSKGLGCYLQLYFLHIQNGYSPQEAQSRASTLCGSPLPPLATPLMIG